MTLGSSFLSKHLTLVLVFLGRSLDGGGRKAVYSGPIKLAGGNNNSLQSLGLLHSFADRISIVDAISSSFIDIRLCSRSDVFYGKIRLFSSSNDGYICFPRESSAREDG